MKDAEIMCQNARFRSSWEPGGDLITLTVRVAGAAVGNDVIGLLHKAADSELTSLAAIIGPNLGANSQHSSLVPDFSNLKSGDGDGPGRGSVREGEWEVRRGQNPAKSVFPSVCRIKRCGKRI